MLSTLPWLWVDVPPITDLPQMMSQATLFLEYLSSADSPYRFQWWTPYSLSTLLFALVRVVSLPFGIDVFVAGKIGMLLIIWTWVVSIHCYLRFQSAPPELIFPAILLTYNPSLYWGFTSFYIGFPFFLWWMMLTDAPPKNRLHVVLGAGVALMLYMSHIFWFGLGVIWLVCSASQSNWKRFLSHSIVPALLMTFALFFWYPTLGANGFDSPTLWGGLTSKLSLTWAFWYGLAGVSGYIELLSFLGAISGVVFFYQHELDPQKKKHLIFGCVLLLVSFLLPMRFQRTILFGSRWIAPALVLVLASACVPSEKFKRVASVVLGTAALLFVVNTSLNWNLIHTEEFKGLRESIRGIKARDPRVIGLTYVETSRYLNPTLRPFMQQFAWAQASHGGQLNFSFAEMSPMPMVFEEDWRTLVNWSTGLEWHPTHVTQADLDQFEYAIVMADSAQHNAFENNFDVRHIAGNGPWKLYQLRDQ